MISVALTLAAAGLLAYFAFPEAHAFVVGSVPLLLALICPVSMLIMMWTMRGRSMKDGCGHVGARQQSLPAPLAKD